MNATAEKLWKFIETTLKNYSLAVVEVKFLDCNSCNLNYLTTDVTHLTRFLEDRQIEYISCWELPIHKICLGWGLFGHFPLLTRKTIGEAAQAAKEQRPYIKLIGATKRR